MKLLITFVIITLCVGSALCQGCVEKVTLTDEYGTIGDRIGNRSYEDAISCTWVIKATAPNARVSLVFDYIDLTYESNSRNSFVSVYDGERTTAINNLVWYTGRDSHTPPIESSGSSLIVFFANWNRFTEQKGFRAHYSTLPCPLECADHGFCFNGTCQCDGGYRGTDCSEQYCGVNECAPHGVCNQQEQKCKCDQGYYGADCIEPYCDEFTILSEKRGEFVDHHPEAQNHTEYLHNSNCSWLIIPDESSPHYNSTLIVLEFKDFDTEEEYDILTVYAGPTTSSPVLGRFSGTELPPPLVSRSSMLITFETDEGVASAGFKASYKMVINEDTPEVEYHDRAWVIAVTFFVALFVGVGLAFGGLYGWKWWKAKREAKDSAVEYSPVDLQLQQDDNDEEYEF